MNKTLTELIEKILKTNETARGNDFVLWSSVCKAITPNVANEPFYKVMANAYEYNLPPMQRVLDIKKEIQSSGKYLPELEQMTLWEDMKC